MHHRCFVSRTVTDESPSSHLLDKVEAELLFNLLSDRYERASTIVTSNLNFGEWVQVFGSEKLTTALLDRLAHHAHILTTKGTSYRSKGKLKP